MQTLSCGVVLHGLVRVYCDKRAAGSGSGVGELAVN
jgi:hypothetical protein